MMSRRGSHRSGFTPAGFGSFNQLGFDPFMAAPRIPVESLDKHVPFDMVLAKPSFPIVMPQPSERSKAGIANEGVLQSALDNRLQALIPKQHEQDKIKFLVQKVQGVFIGLKDFTGDADAFKVDEVHIVGAYRHDNMITDKNLAQMVVFLKVVPTKSGVELLANHVIELIKNNNLEELKMLSVQTNDKGIVLSIPEASIEVLITTGSKVLKNAKLDREKDLDDTIMRQAWWLVQQAEWLGKNASNDKVKNLSRLLQDLTTRFSGLRALSPWMVDVLAYYLIMNNPSNGELPIVVAYRRFFEVMSAGFFLPESTAIIDPCHPMGKAIQFRMSSNEQDEVTTTAQNLLRVFRLGGYKEVVGIEGNSAIATERSVWDGVVVSPLETISHKPFD